MTKKEILEPTQMLLKLWFNQEAELKAESTWNVSEHDLSQTTNKSEHFDNELQNVKMVDPL